MSESVTVVRVGPEALATYAEVPIAFQVRSRLAIEVVDGGLGGFLLREEPVDPPWWKDYDRDGNGPLSWPGRWPIENWGFLLARCDDVPAGGATLAIQSPGVQMTDLYPNSACLWDIRVRAGFRSKGVGSALMRQAELWALERGYRKMHVETQNINVPACRFYRAQGFQLFEVNLRAYPELPDEAMLLWYLDLTR